MKRLILTLGFLLAVPPIVNAQVAQDWVKSINYGNGYSNDRLRGYAVDVSGNVYVTGATPPVSGNIEDMMTLKFNSSGVEQWRVRFDGGYGSDYGEGVTVDGSGNVYVTGYSRGSVNGDYIIIKYNSSGAQQWLTRFNGPGAATDNAKAVVLNSAGYLCVTGVTGNSSTGNDITTVFLDPSDGTVILQDTYNGAGNSDESVTGIIVDGSGNFIVVGTAKSTTVFGSQDFVTIKYDAYGTLQWSRLYNGVGNYYDVTTAVAADGSDNIYVVGQSNLIQSGNSEYVTIKYNSSGDSVWVRRFNPSSENDFVTGVAVDPSGNVFVGGTAYDFSAGYYDAQIIKYNTSGDTVWTRKFGTGDAMSGFGQALAISGVDTILISGYSYYNAEAAVFFARYTSSGTLLGSTSTWAADRYSNSVLGMKTATDGSSCVFVSTYPQGSSSEDYLVLKFDNTPSLQWSAKYSSSDNAGDYARAITVDDSGYIYATGASFWATGGYDNITTVKLYPNGDTVWVRSYNGGSSDDGRAIVVDASGNVYVAGNTYQSSLWKIVTIKYNRDGVQQWAQIYTSGAGDVAHNMTLDGSGNVIVMGAAYTGSTNQDYVTLKYNSSGSQIGTARRYNPSSSTGYDEGHAVLSDGSNGFYVVGWCQPTVSGSNYDIGVVKYGGLAGTQQWAFTYSGIGPWADNGVAICRDSLGYIYVVGTTWLAAGWVPDLVQSHNDIIVLKLTTAGDTLWTKKFGGASYRDDYAMDIAYDGHGGLYISGLAYNQSSPYDADMSIFRIDTAGTLLWDHTFNRPGRNDNECPSSLAVDTAGNAYLAGTAGYKWGYLTVQSKDMTVLRYDRVSGNLAWSTFYNGSADTTDDVALGMSVDRTGNVFLAGQSVETSGGYNLTVVRLSQSIALPVEMTGLVSSVSGMDVTLSWATATEVDNSGFEVERRIVSSQPSRQSRDEPRPTDRDGSSVASSQTEAMRWEKIAFVPGAGTSTALKEYSFGDIGLKAGRYAYRLKQIDRNGVFTYSYAVEVEVGVVPKEFTLSQNYPNPFNPSTTIEYSLQTDDHVLLRVYDALGREVVKLVDEAQVAGVRYRALFDAKDFTTGLYFVRLESGGKSKTQKMILMK